MLIFAACTGTGLPHNAIAKIIPANRTSRDCIADRVSVLSRIRQSSDVSIAFRLEITTSIRRYSMLMKLLRNRLFHAWSSKYSAIDLR